MEKYISNVLFGPKFLRGVKEAARAAIYRAKTTKTKLVIYRDDEIVYKSARQALTEISAAKK